MARLLGTTQKNWLACVIEHGGKWYVGCGFYWNNRSSTVRLCESLVKRKLMVRTTNNRGNPMHIVTASGRSTENKK